MKQEDEEGTDGTLKEYLPQGRVVRERGSQVASQAAQGKSLRSQGNVAVKERTVDNECLMLQKTESDK